MYIYICICIHPWSASKSSKSFICIGSALGFTILRRLHNALDISDRRTRRGQSWRVGLLAGWLTLPITVTHSVGPHKRVQTANCSGYHRTTSAPPWVCICSDVYLSGAAINWTNRFLCAHPSASGSHSASGARYLIRITRSGFYGPGPGTIKYLTQSKLQIQQNSNLFMA